MQFKKIGADRKISRAYRSVKLAVVGALVTASGFAMADDPGVTAINGLAATATSYIAAAFAVAVLVAGGFWGIKMMRKSFNKA